jgi:hypothetical protein
MNIESELKNALRRVPPAEGFAARVLARIAAEPAERRQPNWWWRAAAAALLLAAMLGGLVAHQAIERREGERARRQVMLALRIAGAKVAHAQREVRDIGSRHIQ